MFLYWRFLLFILFLLFMFSHRDVSCSLADALLCSLACRDLCAFVFTLRVYVHVHSCAPVLKCLRSWCACVLGVLTYLTSVLTCWACLRDFCAYVLTFFCFVCCDKMFYELISSCASYFLFVLLSLNFKLNFKNSFTEKCLKKIVKVGLSRLRKFLPN